MTPTPRRERHDAELLLGALRDPSRLARRSRPARDRTLRLARRALVLPRLAVLAERAGVIGDLDDKSVEILVAASETASHHRRTLRWEIDRLTRVMSRIGEPVLLLKGAAYEAAGLPSARGRMASDVDILVPRDRLDVVERHLERNGWRSDTDDPYDVRYYRTWMHELPPLRHEGRGTILDVHHTIAPPTSRGVRPDVPALIRDARPTGDPRIRVPCAEDLVVHAAVHAFHDGDLTSPLRDLIDVDDLTRDLASRDERFWVRLVERARRHRAQVPLAHALRLASVHLDTPVPDDVRDDLGAAGRPGWMVEWLDRAVAHVLTPWIDGPPPPGREIARGFLYARSHALRMPLRLLVPHLGRKAWRRRFRGNEER